MALAVHGQDRSARTGETDNNTVIPGEDGKFIQASDEIPASGGIPSYKDAKREDGEWVHELPRS
jgi:hypothetical protein